MWLSEFTASEESRIDQLDPYVFSPQAWVSESMRGRTEGGGGEIVIMFLAIGGDIGPVKQQFLEALLGHLIFFLLSLTQGCLYSLELKELAEIIQTHKHIPH